MQTWVDLKFADGEYTFRLGLAQINELERKCDAGIGRIFARTLTGRYGMGDGDAMPDNADYRMSELIEIVRQGLIGGGNGVVDGVPVNVTSVQANALISHYVLDANTRNPIRTTWALAAAVLHALIEGYDPGPKAEPADGPATPTSGSTTQERSPTAP